VNGSSTKSWQVLKNRTIWLCNFLPRAACHFCSVEHDNLEDHAALLLSSFQANSSAPAGVNFT
jgi:hypothetical protein